MVEIREFKIEDKALVLDMWQEIKNHDGNFEGFLALEKANSYEELLEKFKTNKDRDLLPPDRSVQTTYGIFDDGKLAGVINLRHELVGQLLTHGGNVGYIVRPTMRNKGYATKALGLVCDKARGIGLTRILVTCRVGNESSAKVIEKNGGKLENIYFEPNMNENFKRYWIELD